MTDIPRGLTSRQEIVEIDIFDRLSGSIRDALGSAERIGDSFG